MGIILTHLLTKKWEGTDDTGNFPPSKPRLSEVVLLAAKGWPLAQSTSHTSSLPQANVTKMRWKSCAQPSAVPWEGLLQGTCDIYGEGRKRINFRFLRSEEDFGLSGILWRLFLTQNCRSPLLIVSHSKFCGAGQADRDACVHLQQMYLSCGLLHWSHPNIFNFICHCSMLVHQKTDAQTSTGQSIQASRNLRPLLCLYLWWMKILGIW